MTAPTGDARATRTQKGCPNPRACSHPDICASHGCAALEARRMQDEADIRGCPTPGACSAAKLFAAAEDVVSRWSVVRASGGKLGDCGLTAALTALEVCVDDASPPDEVRT